MEKSQVMILMEGFKKDINKSLKEIQNTSKQVVSLEELRENTHLRISAQG